MTIDITDNKPVSVTEARNSFSLLVNKAVFGDEITLIHRGHSQKVVAAIVPADFMEQYQALLDLVDGMEATKRLKDLEEGRDTLISEEEMKAEFGW